MRGRYERGWGGRGALQCRLRPPLYWEVGLGDSHTARLLCGCPCQPTGVGSGGGGGAARFCSGDSPVFFASLFFESPPCVGVYLAQLWCFFFF